MSLKVLISIQHVINYLEVPEAAPLVSGLLVLSGNENVKMPQGIIVRKNKTKNSF